MKKVLLIIPALLFSLLTFSQGIVFEKGTWKEVLAKAQQSNKPIFIDVYTSWCGPCKQMSNDIFPLETVGKAYNENFICYQIDAEKGEGKAIAKQYAVKVFPTYLFIKPDKSLFYSYVGSMPEKKFIEVSQSALVEMKDPKPIAVWDKEYILKKNDTTFLLEYITKRKKLGLSNTVLFDKYLKLLPEHARTSSFIVEWYRKEGNYLRVNTFAYTNLLANHEKFYDKIASYSTMFLIQGIKNTINDASATQNKLSLDSALIAFDRLPKSAINPQKDELYMQYYKNTSETEKYISHAITFGNNYLMKFNVDSVTKKDKETFQDMEKQFKSPLFSKIDSTRRAGLLNGIKNFKAREISESLNQIAWEVFSKVTDQKIMHEALNWSKRSQEFMPNNAKYLNTYANLCYKLGQKEEAIASEKDALRYADTKDLTEYNLMEETLRKMNAGEKTW